MEDDFHKTILTVSFLVTALFAMGGVASYFNHKQNKEEKIPPLAKMENNLEPDISAQAVMVMRQKTGQVLFSKNADLSLPVASITKLMTSVIFLENMDIFDRVEISGDAKTPVEEGEKLSRVGAGEWFKAEDLLKLMVIDSDNDMARSAAEAVSLKLAPELKIASFQSRLSFFTSLMNKKKEALGMSGSNFDNPAGLDSLNNYSTAGDLAKLALYISQNHPRVWDISRIYETDVVSASGSGLKYHLENTNPLLKEMPDIVGTKTGSTDGAKKSLVLVVNAVKDEPVIFVILRSEDRVKDAKILVGWTKLVFGL